jgi:hypothetical protein
LCFFDFSLSPLCCPSLCFAAFLLHCLLASFLFYFLLLFFSFLLPCIFLFFASLPFYFFAFPCLHFSVFLPLLFTKGSAKLPEFSACFASLFGSVASYLLGAFKLSFSFPTAESCRVSISRSGGVVSRFFPPCQSDAAGFREPWNLGTLSPTCLSLVSHLSPTCPSLVFHLSRTCLPLVFHLSAQNGICQLSHVAQNIPNRRFQLQNNANSMQNRRFHLQNAATRMEKARAARNQIRASLGRITQ